MDLSTVSASVGAAIIVQLIAWLWLKERLSRSIKHEYDKDLEKLKHDLMFELDRRKRLYEGKLAQYKHYYRFLDEYSQQGRQEVFSNFINDFLKLIREPSDDTFAMFIKRMLDAQADLGSRFLVFKTEINGLRLEAGEKLLSLLNEYTEALEVAQKETVAFMSGINSKLPQLANEPSAFQNELDSFMAAEFGGVGARLKELQESIFREMRRELGVI